MSEFEQQRVVVASSCLVLPALVGIILLAVFPSCEAESVVADASGDKAMDYVRSTPYTKVAIEVDSVEGHGPGETPLRWSRLAIGEVLGKQTTTEINLDDDALPAQSDPAHRYTLDEIRALEAQNRDTQTGGDTAVFYVIAVDGQYHTDAPGSFTLGVSYSGSSMVLFMSTIRRLCAKADATDSEEDEQALCAMAIATTLVHELGHAIGLVNNGLPMAADHHDTEHGAHDINDECVMHWLNAAEAMLARLASRIESGDKEGPSPFCDRCLADIEASK